MDSQPVNEETLETTGPYIGLRPYEECNQDIFFGREEERDILIDKLIANKLTLLFAATGVGKSSLLRAGVLPALKRKKKESLDVVYYCDWVSDPLEHLKKETVAVLRAQQKITQDYPLYQEDEDISLKKFFRLASAFASEPLVVILDQFEEFFQYRRYKENFNTFIEEFSQCVNDQERQVVFLVSMREDFALELNVFKKYLPTILFDNYFRLEKLTVEKAREAIVKPLEPFGFEYEGTLLVTLLTDLAKREEEARLGAAPAALGKDSPLYVEPPYLQIVCSRLWEVDRDNPGKKIRETSYQQMGEARGIVDLYFNGVMDTFSLQEKNTASYAFNLLVTSRGTKMAYTVEDLSDRIGTTEKDLENVLQKLRNARILRSQKREGVIWYELYHDVFSIVITKWAKIFTNINSHYLRLSHKETNSNKIEIYKGNLKATDIYNLHVYQAETTFERDRMEPDKLFVEKQLDNFEQLNREIIGHLPLIDRISTYWETGEIKTALDLANRSISIIDINRSRQIINLLREFCSIKSYRILKSQLEKPDNIYIREVIIELLALMPSTLVIKDLIELLKDKSSQIRNSAASALGQLGAEQAVFYLIRLIEDPDIDVRSSAVRALGQIGNEKTLKFLIELFKDLNPEVRVSAIDALAKTGDEKIVKNLLPLLKDSDKDVRSSTAEALGQICSEKALKSLMGLLYDANSKVRVSAVSALAQIGNEKIVKNILDLIKDEDKEVRSIAADALGDIGNEKVVEPIISLLKDKELDVRGSAVIALGQIGSETAVESLLDLLKDPDSDIRDFIIEAVDKIGSEKAVELLLVFLMDPNKNVRTSAAKALGQLGSEKEVEPLINLLRDKNADVRQSAAEALGELGSEKAVEFLLVLLKDKNPLVRSSAVEALGIISNPIILEPILKLLEVQNSDVLNSTILTLGQIGNEKVITSLIGLLKNSESYIRSFAAIALSQLGIEKAVDTLFALLKEPNENMRQSVVEALGELGSEKVVETLIELLKDPDYEVRINASEALGQIGSEKAVEVLIGLFNDNRYGDLILQAYYELEKFGESEEVEQFLGFCNGNWSTNVNCRAVEALGQIGSVNAIPVLLQLLRDQDKDIQASAAEALGKIDNITTIEPLAKLVMKGNSELQQNAILSLGKLFAREKIEVIKKCFINIKQKPNVRLVAAATLLKLGDTSGLEYLKDILKLDNVHKRIELANTLGEAPSKHGNSILIEMLSDENIRLKEAVISSLGKAKEKSALPYLNQLIQYPNTRIRAAAVGALAEIAAPESIELLKNVALNINERVVTRHQAIIGLAKTQHQDALQILIEFIEHGSRIIRYKTLIAIGKNPPAESLPNDLLNRLKVRLKDKLTELVEHKAQWRKIRDEKTESYNEEKLKDWNKRLEEFEPNEPMEFELSFVLSRMDPFNEGVKLLGHHLANVRQGAWQGLGKSRDVSLIETLYWQRKQSDIPWFVHAAYRAIDHILMNIEAFGGREELKRLESLYKTLSEKEGENFHEGVQTRMEWTIDRLRERL